MACQTLEVSLVSVGRPQADGFCRVYDFGNQPSQGDAITDQNNNAITDENGAPITD